MADVTPLHKKGKKDLKENCRPVSILPIISKVFERSMFAQMWLPERLKYTIMSFSFVRKIEMSN